MRYFFLLAATAFFSTIAYGQAQLDSTLVIDSLEVAEAEEEMLYKTDTADFVYYALPSALEYIPGDDHPEVLAELPEYYPSATVSRHHSNFFVHAI